MDESATLRNGMAADNLHKKPREPFRGSQASRTILATSCGRGPAECITLVDFKVLKWQSYCVFCDNSAKFGTKVANSKYGIELLQR